VARAEQDQRIANDITAAERCLLTARDTPEIQAILSTRGYGPTELADGLALQAAAQTAFNARQTAMARADLAQSTHDALDASAREHFTDYRGTVRSIFADKADQSPPGATGRVPDDEQKFITAVRAAYDAAKKAPYAAKLAKYGYPAETLDSAKSELDTLNSAGSGVDTADAAAAKATKTRDAACDALLAWMKQFKGIARVALKKQAELLSKLGL
jgi:hypothetical protein